MSRSPRPNLVIRLERRLDDLAAALLARVREAHPALADADAAAAAETLGEARGLLRSFFACYLEGREPDAAELESALRDGTRRAGQAVPLEDLLAACHQGGEALWEAAVAEAGHDEQPELVDFARHLLHWQGLLARAAATAFVRELRHLEQGAQAARRQLAETLLAATPLSEDTTAPPPPELVERAEVRVPDRGDVVAYRVLDGDGPVGAAAQSVQWRLDELAGEAVLGEFAGDGGVALVPAEADLRAERVVEALRETLGAPIVAGAAEAGETRAVRAAAREARELLALALTLDRPPGVYRRDHLLLEHAITARPSSVRALAALLDPLGKRPNLLDTLETWFAQDFDRRGTAEALAVHRNTLDYRLRRITDLTGIVLDSARGLQTAGAALLARRVTRAAEAPPGRRPGR